MAKKITINLSDEEFDLLKDVYSKNNSTLSKADIDEEYIKNSVVRILKARVRKYDKARTVINCSSFEPT